MSRWIQRDAAGAMIGHFANEQPYAKEEAPDDHPDILAAKAARDAYRLADHNTSSNERLRTAEARLGLTETNLEVIRSHLAELLTLKARVAALEKRLSELER